MTVPRDERGLTVTELVVTVMILSLVSIVLFGFLDSTTSVTARASRDVDAEETARTAFRTVTQEIRGANPILTTYPAASPSCPPAGTFPTGFRRCLTFEVNRSTVAGMSCPRSLITYGVRDDGFLREDRTDLDASCNPSGSYTGRVLLGGVVNDPSTPVFSFFDATGAQVTSTDPASMPAYTGARSLSVTLVVRYQQNAPNLTLTSALALRNNR